MVDSGFDATKEHVLFLQVNTTTSREYVGEVKRNIRTVKKEYSVPQGTFIFGPFQPWYSYKWYTMLHSGSMHILLDQASQECYHRKHLLQG